MKPAYLFGLGRVVATPGALAVIPRSSINGALSRHQRGDFGDVCDTDAELNRKAIADGSRILSSYYAADTRFWIITEADRSSTTILLPEEY